MSREWRKGDMLEYISNELRDWKVAPVNKKTRRRWEFVGKISINKGDRGLIVDVENDFCIVFLFVQGVNTVALAEEDAWKLVKP